MKHLNQVIQVTPHPPSLTHSLSSSCTGITECKEEEEMVIADDILEDWDDDEDDVIIIA